MRRNIEIAEKKVVKKEIRKYYVDFYLNFIKQLYI